MTKAKKQPNKKKPQAKTPKIKKPESVADILRRRQEEAEGKNVIQNVPQNDKNQTLNNFKKKGLENNKNSDGKGLRHEAEYQAFIEFCATPAVYRDIENQNEFAQKFKVSLQTLSAWKKRPDFERRYLRALKDFVRGDLVGKAIASLNRKILKEGGAPEVKLMLQLGGVLEDKSSVEIKTDSGLTDEQKAGFANRLARWKKENL